MRGRRWAVMAAFVAAGRLSRSAHRTGSPALAAHAAAGMANSGALEGATTTARVGAPAAAVWSLSIAWASAAGSAPSTSELRRPFGLAVLPIADHLRLAGLLRAGRAELVERGLRRLGQLVAVGEQDRRAQRAAHQLGGGDRRAPVLDVDERDGGRAGCRASARGRSPGPRPRRWRPRRRRPRASCSSWRSRGSRGPAPPPRRRRPARPRAGAACRLSPCSPPPQPAANASRSEQEEERSDGHVRGHASRCPSRRPHAGPDAPTWKKLFKPSIGSADLWLDITRHGGIQCRGERRVPGVMPGSGGPSCVGLITSRAT